MTAQEQYPGDMPGRNAWQGCSSLPHSSISDGFFGVYDALSQQR